MELIIHDLKEDRLKEIYKTELEGEYRIISGRLGEPRACMGCFGCWIRTPGTCVVKDEYQNMGQWLAAADTLVIISRCEYGSFSSYIKTILDRSISYILPYFVKRNGEVHHASRYEKILDVKVIFYGADITEAESRSAESLVKANCINLNANLASLKFMKALS